MNVAAIIVTKGDQSLTPILASLPEEWERIVWNNGAKQVWIDRGGEDHRWVDGADLHVYGRYAAIEYTDAELIYVQDDDCIVSDPQKVVDAWFFPRRKNRDAHVVCNMPPDFRHEFYEDHALVGFGAVFHRDAPQRAFGHIGPQMFAAQGPEFFYRTCDIVFTALTPRVLVDVPYENMPWAYYYDRMYRQPEHLAERARMLELVTQVRDG